MQPLYSYVSFLPSVYLSFTRRSIIPCHHSRFIVHHREVGLGTLDFNLCTQMRAHALQVKAPCCTGADCTTSQSKPLVVSLPPYLEPLHEVCAHWKLFKKIICVKLSLNVYYHELHNPYYFFFIADLLVPVAMCPGVCVPTSTVCTSVETPTFLVSTRWADCLPLLLHAHLSPPTP